LTKKKYRGIAMSVDWSGVGQTLGGSAAIGTLLMMVRSRRHQKQLQADVSDTKDEVTSLNGSSIVNTVENMALDMKIVKVDVKAVRREAHDAKIRAQEAQAAAAELAVEVGKITRRPR
jgi:hypothetical protein